MQHNNPIIVMNNRNFIVQIIFNFILNLKIFSYFLSSQVFTFKSHQLNEMIVNWDVQFIPAKSNFVSTLTQVELIFISTSWRCCEEKPYELFWQMLWGA